MVAAVLAGRRLVSRMDCDLEGGGLTWGLFHALGRRALARAYADLADVFAAIDRLSVAERKQVISAASSMRRELNRRSRWGVWEATTVPRGNVSNG